MKPTEEQINIWFNTFWTSYPADLCNGKRGGKVPGLKAFKKVATSEDEFNRILANMKAQIKADRSEKDPYRWPFVSSYLNQCRFDDYIMPVNDIERQELKTCKENGCRQDVHGPSFDVCSEHVPNAHREYMKQAWIRIGIQNGSPDFVEQCRQQCRERMNLLMGKSDELL
jgi:hypothetical protein